MSKPSHPTSVSPAALLERYRAFGIEPFTDAEFLALCLSLPLRRDPYPVAEALLERFESLPAVLDASREALEEVSGMTPKAALLLQLVKGAGTRYLRTRAANAPALSTAREVVDFCRHTLARRSFEAFMLIFLNKKNRVIDSMIFQEGTIDHVSISPRRVVEQALEKHACGLILCHNHPSGDPAPSQADEDITRRITAAARTVGITVIDHVVVSTGGYASFWETGKMREVYDDLEIAERCHPWGDEPA